MQVLGKDLRQKLRFFLLLAFGQFGIKAQAALAHTLSNNVGKTHERTAQNEQDVIRVDMDKLLLRMLASTLRGNRSIGPFDNLQQRLLHTFARNVAGDRKILGLLRNLIDLIDVDNADFGTGNIEIRSRNELQQDILNVFADITRFSQRGSIGNREGHLQRTRKRFGQKRLT